MKNVVFYGNSHNRKFQKKILNPNKISVNQKCRSKQKLKFSLFFVKNNSTNSPKIRHAAFRLVLGKIVKIPPIVQLRKKQKWCEFCQKQLFGTIMKKVSICVNSVITSQFHLNHIFLVICQINFVLLFCFANNLISYFYSN